MQDFLKQLTEVHKKNETRRLFLKDKLLKGLFFLVFAPFYGIAKDSYEPSEHDFNFHNNGDNEIDWEKVRKQFTLDNRLNHFNTASVGSSPEIVQKKTISMIRHINQFAKINHIILEETRCKLANLVQADSSQIAITRNATEGINIVARSLKLNRGDEVIITSEEHIGGTAPWLTLQNEIGIKVVVVDILGQEFDAVNLLKSAISDRTKVISASHITYTTGAILPIKEIINLCKKEQIYSVIDGAQALGQIPINLRELQPDFYSAGCCKWLFGPTGTGMLYLNQSFLENFPPLFAGAYTDRSYDAKKGQYEYITHASRYEYGTINAPIIAGLGAAVDFITQIGVGQIAKRSKNLALRFREGIANHTNIRILTPANQTEFAGIVTFNIQKKNNVQITQALRSGRSTILRGIFENDMDAIRASFAIYASEEQVDLLVKHIRRIADEPY